MRNILVRADASSSIGTGHVMRDLVLVQRFSDDRVIFATRDLPGNINKKIESAGYPVISLNSDAEEELIGVMLENGIDMIVIDHYGIDDSYEKKLKEETGAEIFVLDDTYEKHFCDILLNHNLNAVAEKYAGLVPLECELQCGIEHTLLRREFSQIVLRAREIAGKKKLNVFVAMGGADHSAKTVPILDLLVSLGNMNATVVTTSANRAVDELMKYASDHPCVTLHVDSDQIAMLMNRCDFAIVTPSVIANEVMHLLLPFIAIKTADNQKEIAAFLEAKAFDVINDFSAEALSAAIDRLIKNYPVMVKRMKCIVKGKSTV